MMTETPQTLLLLTVGSFVFGWIVAKLGSYIGTRVKTRKRDPRDGRIRSLEADLRVAQSNVEKIKSQLDDRSKELGETQKIVRAKEASCDELASTITRLRDDLRESVKKTRELRSELTERATEHVRSEVMLREVQTELSVAQASTDLLATGVLDYNVDAEEDEELPAFKAGA